MDDTDDDDPPVGYGSPPRHSQFQAGRSGNPGGRPRGSKDRSAMFAAIMFEPASYSEGGVKYSGTKLELLVRTISIQRAKGNPKAADLHDQLSGHLDSAEEAVPRGLFISERKLTEEAWLAKYGHNAGG